MARDAAPPALADFVRFAKLKKAGFLTLAPRSGRPPLTVHFATHALPATGALAASFAFRDRVLYLSGQGVTAAHAKGLQQTLKGDGWFNITVTLQGASVQVEGSRFDGAADDWARMKAVLDRHPMDVPLEQKYRRIEELMRATPPDTKAIRKAMRVIAADVKKLEATRGGHGKTSEEGAVRVNDRARIQKLKRDWVTLERQVRTTPMGRAEREDFALMEKLVAEREPDELALAATFERLSDFVKKSAGRAARAGGDADATRKAADKLLAAWRKEVEPELAPIIAGWVKAQGSGADEAKRLLARGRALPAQLESDRPDLTRGKATLAFFLKAKAVAKHPPRPAEGAEASNRAG